MIVRSGYGLRARPCLGGLGRHETGVEFASTASTDRAEPVDDPVIRHERRGLQVADQAMVFNRWVRVHRDPRNVTVADIPLPVQRRVGAYLGLAHFRRIRGVIHITGTAVSTRISLQWSKYASAAPPPSTTTGARHNHRARHKHQGDT